MYETIEPEGHGDHQLLPVKGGRYKTPFHGPPGTDVGTLHCDLEPLGDDSGKILVMNHSGWRPSDEQILQLEAGAHVRLTLWTHPIPPIAMSIEPPVCGCHDEAMSWSEEEGGYYCVHQKTTDTSSASTTFTEEEIDSAFKADSALQQARRDFKPDTPQDDPSSN